MNYSTLTSQLQSRLARRASAITNEVNWSKAFRAQEQMTDYRNSKKVIAEMNAQQVLDKKLLAKITDAEQMEKAYNELCKVLADLED